MELGPPIPDIPLWEPAAAVTPVTVVATSVVSQVAQSVVEVSLPDFLPVTFWSGVPGMLCLLTI